MTDEEGRFRAAVKASMVAVRAFARHLQLRGMSVIVYEVRIRPHRDQREGYGDTEDLTACWEDGPWRRFEIKWRTYSWTCCDDFPFPNGMIVDRLKDTPLADWYVGISRDLNYAAIVDGKTSDQWSIKNIYDKTKGYGGPVRYCTLDLVQFVRLLK